MTALVKNLADTVTKLHPKDRAYLAERLLASLEDADWEEQWGAEGASRREEIRLGRIKPVSAGEVYRRIESLLKK